MGTYIINKPGGAITQHGPHSINCHRSVTLLNCIHSLFPAL